MEIKSPKIGIFDSGIGGLTVYKELIQKEPHIDIVYYADHAFMPYGTKSSKEIVDRCEFITNFLLSKECNIIVVACNSATAMAIDQLRIIFPHIPFVGIEPFIKYIQNIDIKKHSAALLTTNTTSTSERFKKLQYQYDPKDNLKVYPCPKLAEFVESNFLDIMTDNNEEEITNNLKMLLNFIPQNTFTHFILGCTHYPLLSKYLVKIFNVEIISPEPYVANRFFSLVSGKSNKINFEFHSSKFESFLSLDKHLTFPLNTDDPWYLFFSKQFK